MITTENAAELTYNTFASALPESLRPLLRSHLMQLVCTAEANQSAKEHQRRVEASQYNGWANRETWLVGLWWQECPIESVEADTKEDAVRLLADQLEESFHEITQQPEEGLALDLYYGATRRINWHEIAEHWIDDIELILPETEESHA